MSRDPIAVIVPCYNAEGFLGPTLQSILDQDFGAFRLYVVDDGSRDSTREVVARFASDRRVEYLYQDNAGQAAAINRGLRAGREPYVSLCDADDLWRPDRLRLALAALEADPSLGLVCNDFARGTDPGRPWVSAWKTRGYHPISGDAFGRILEHNFIPRSGVLMPRSILEQVGDFSEPIGGQCGCDDWDMWLKIARARPILCLHETLTFKRDLEGQYSTRLGQARSRVLLWEHWENQLRAQGGPWHELTARHLSQSLVELSYKMIVEKQSRRQARRELVRAARFGAPLPQVLRVMVRSFL
jgi:glycosyltransferase involved in cell wall biosynthesis